MKPSTRSSQFHPELTSATTIERFERLRAGRDTPEMATLLSRLVRGDYR